MMVGFGLRVMVIDLKTIFDGAGSWYMFYAFLYHTGLRAGDVASLRYGNIDFKKKSIVKYVRKSRRIHENPIADVLGDGDDSSCQYSSFINFGCTYENAINFNVSSNVDDGSCEYIFGDLNDDNIINILDIVQLVNIVLTGEG